MFTKEDIKQIEAQGLSIKQVENQIDNFKKGFPFAKIKDAATIKNGGIKKIEQNEINHYVQIFNNFAKNNRITKFVPASGAASRMFKNLYAFLDSNNQVSDFVKYFFENINKFAFYQELKQTLEKHNVKISESNIKPVIETLLKKEGLNYGNLPKGLLLFHKYNDEIRTAFAEHLYESSMYAVSKDNISNIVFTVSPEHKILFKQLLDKLKDKYQDKYKVYYKIKFTEQSKSTDTIAVNKDNTIYRDKNKRILFRPGGHGALIKNLNEINSDIIFIKNIDNVVHENYFNDTLLYKKLIAGILINIQEKVFYYINELKNNNLKNIQDILDFVENSLCFKFDNELFKAKDNKLASYIISVLDRPIRVCGMVKNEGEPGGGPFWVENNDNTLQLQIVESSEIDVSKKENIEILKKSTHFNPVDIVCSVKRYNGEKFDLNKFINHNAGFISTKSVDGKEIKAQELPGLWNGAMANWNTVFVEVPVSTFNPVKTVNDLLRKYHQP